MTEGISPDDHDDENAIVMVIRRWIDLYLDFGRLMGVALRHRDTIRVQTWMTNKTKKTVRATLPLSIGKVLKRLHDPLAVILPRVRWCVAYSPSLRNLEGAINRNGEPATIAVDESGVNLAALEALNSNRPTAIKVRQSKYLNDVVEQDHRAITPPHQADDRLQGFSPGRHRSHAYDPQRANSRRWDRSTFCGEVLFDHDLSNPFHIVTGSIYPSRRDKTVFRHRPVRAPGSLDYGAGLSLQIWQ